MAKKSQSNELTSHFNRKHLQLVSQKSQVRQLKGTRNSAVRYRILKDYAPHISVLLINTFKARQKKIFWYQVITADT